MMTTNTSDRKKYWMMTLVSLVGTLLFLVFLPEWFWVMLPFLGTAFVYAMDWA